MRWGSVTRAADELALTQSAVSHRLRVLGGGIRGPQSAGAPEPGPAADRRRGAAGTCAAAILAGLERLPRAVLQPRARRSPSASAPGRRCSAGWSSPRLKALGAAFPGIVLRSRPSSARPMPSGATSTWRCSGCRGRRCATSRGCWRSPPEHVFPVAAPSLARARTVVRPAAPSRAASDLTGPVRNGPGRAGCRRPTGARRNSRRDLPGALQLGVGMATGRRWRARRRRRIRSVAEAACD